MFGWSISFFFRKLYATVPITGIFFTKPPSPSFCSILPVKAIYQIILVYIAPNMLFTFTLT